MEIKDILRATRKSHNLTMDDVAEGADISKSVYPKYESGILNPGLPVIIKLADFYGVTTDYLLGREPQKDPFAELSLCAEDEQAVIDKYMSLPPEIRAMLLDVMRQLAGATSTPAE